ncbi:lipopolysaccharide biosynthesis protein [Piscinibacter sp.]|uniref:lipopolysaccharide biosynthesis protein n=1 Tax=Piscinibacter sp. TaxID=1903157 RepID=UPI002C9A8CC9|nr:lipopolysaccharide biosynthesis protein [Albitalea sp.]HUG26225.1 lipopolysaccharide biosynthesis protein [Albitalea sp.]
MTAGAIWMVLFKLVERGLGLISTLILARLLGPEDFGIVAMALSFIAMAELMTAFGFDVALIQTRSATQAHYNAAWTCNVLLNLCVTLLMAALALPIADFYQKPEVAWVVWALAFGPLIAGLENVGVVAFRKELDFRREFTFQVSRKLIGFMIVVPVALLLRSYWALVIGILMSKTAGTVISYFMHPFRPRLSLSKFGELFRFSRWYLLNNVLVFLKERGNAFFLGRLYGPASLGSYTVAYELAHLPSTEIGAPINRALLPGFAKMASEDVKHAYGSAVGVLAMLALPAAVVLFVVAPFLVPIMLGPKWLSVVPLMQVLAFNGALLLFHSSISAVLMGRGLSSRVTAANAAYVTLLVALLSVFAARFGVVGVAWCTLLTTVLCTPVYLYQIRRGLGIGAMVFVRATARPVAAAAPTAAVLHWALPGHHPTMSLWVSGAWLAAGVVAAVALYTATVCVLWLLAGRPEGAERAVYRRVRDTVKRWLAPPASPVGRRT